MYLYRAAATVKCHFSEVLETLLEEDMAYVLKLAHSDLRQCADRDHRMDAECITCVIWIALSLQKDAPHLVKLADKGADGKCADVFSENHCMSYLSELFYKIIPLVFPRSFPLVFTRSFPCSLQDHSPALYKTIPQVFPK
jgi:hypothetical protein